MKADAKAGKFAVLNEDAANFYRSGQTKPLDDILRSSKATRRKPRAQAKGRAVNKGPSFGEWARRVAGMVKSGERDLSTREGFGD